MITDKVDGIIYGGDYNPEQWPPETWHEDVRLMRVAGVNLVSVGIFSWARLEPAPGQYDFTWLDQVLDMLNANGVKACLATATASPPPWLAKLHPGTLPVTADGTTLWPGGRQQYCPSSHEYRRAASNLVRKIAERYRDHPALAVWHVNNEYGCHVSECYCDESAQAFRGWLRERYGTIEALNEAWGTAFWSQHYGDWDEINPPRTAPTFANPTQQLDFRRFSSDALLECFEMERAILREITPDIPATTNFMGAFKPLDYWKWAAHEDVVSHDSYPDPLDPHSHVGAAGSYDLIRSLSDGNPWMLMEQAPTRVNWRRQNALKRPGQMRLWSYQAVARGAEAVMFFQWRASRAGAEKFHGGMVPHSGENTRSWREIHDLGQELRKLRPVIGTKVRSEIALLFDWESWWALELDSKPSTDVRQLAQVQSYYAPLYGQNLVVDFAYPNADLSKYKLVLLPSLYMVSDDTVRNLTNYVRAGGTLVMSFFSGIVDPNEHIRLGGYPVPFREMLGIRVEDFDAYAPGQTNRIKLQDGISYGCDLWSDIIDLDGAESLASYEQDFYSGTPAVTRNNFGEGTAYYLGTRPDVTFMGSFLGKIASEANCTTPLSVPAGVEVTIREGDTGQFTFLLNHNHAAIRVTLLDEYEDILTGDRLRNETVLDAYGVAILRRLG